MPFGICYGIQGFHGRRKKDCLEFCHSTRRLSRGASRPLAPMTQGLFPLLPDSARATVSLKFKSDGVFVSAMFAWSHGPYRQRFQSAHVQQDRFRYTLSVDFVRLEEAILAKRLNARRIHEKEISLNTGCGFTRGKEQSQFFRHQQRWQEANIGKLWVRF